MANELRVRQNFLGGKIEDNPLTAAATTLTSAALAAMSAIGSTQHMPITLDPDGLYGEPEIAYVTAHTAAATTATILRAQEGTTARQHRQDVDWTHGPTGTDLLQPVWTETRMALSVETTTSTTFADLATVGPVCSVTIGQSGSAMVAFSCYISSNASATPVMAIAVSGATTRAADENRGVYGPQNTGYPARVGATYIFSGLTPGVNVFTAKYRIAAAGTATFADRSLIVTPLP